MLQLRWLKHFQRPEANLTINNTTTAYSSACFHTNPATRLQYLDQPRTTLPERNCGGCGSVTGSVVKRLQASTERMDRKRERDDTLLGAGGVSNYWLYYKHRDAITHAQDVLGPGPVRR